MPKLLSLPSLSLPQRLWRNSQTKLLAYTQAAGATVLASVDVVHELVTSTDVRAALEPLHMPVWVPLSLAIVGVFTYLAHGHNSDA